MERKLKYHLFPEQVVNYVWQGKQCSVQGIHKAPDMQHDKEHNTWLRLEPKPDAKGQFWWEEADLIAIVKGQRSFSCDICQKAFSPKRVGFLTSQRIVEPAYYIGLLDMDGCTPPPWGYTTKICLECAREIFKDAIVYRCDPDEDWCAAVWLSEAPKIDRPKIKLIDELSPFLCG
jgi:hypothetical protein